MYKAYCDEAKAAFLCLVQKKKSQIRLNLRLLAEMVGFEPTCPVKDKTISSRSRYDHFDTSPYSLLRGGVSGAFLAHCPSLFIIAKTPPAVNQFSGRSPCFGRTGVIQYSQRLLQDAAKNGASGRAFVLPAALLQSDFTKRRISWHNRNRIWAAGTSKSCCFSS